MIRLSLFASFFYLFSISSSASSCLTIENGKRTLCNNYNHLKKKDPVKLKKLCSAGNLNMAGMVIKNLYKEEKCPTDGAKAKCILRGQDTTIYYNGEFKDLEKGCKVFKSAVFEKLNK
ncbi:MAG: hypothetical protein NXH75_17070 [Halobacteriovoraceae bacterium]|nr:hypothetical protein [Halobacteriovoraceae bacterium]